MTILCASLVALAATTGPAEPTSPLSKPDPTLISVPSNTLGPGVPLWVVREQAESAARISRAEASYAEARAALAHVEAQAATDNLVRYGGLVVYGPRRPGLSWAIAHRPIPRLIARPTPPAPRANADDAFEDQGATAQRIYSEASRPPIGPSIENQLQAQRRFGENAAPPVAKTQRQRDDAVIRIRKAPKAAQ